VAALDDHLRAWLGEWPPPQRLHVVGSDARTRPGWDGRAYPVVGVSSLDGTVLSVPHDRADAAAAVAADSVDVAHLLARLPEVMGGGRGFVGVFRWSLDPAPLADAGVWMPWDDPRVPAWLHPFGHEVLVTLRGDEVVAGVGLKHPDRYGRELAVVTEPAARGRGLGRRLVAQAARAVLADGAVPTYLHGGSNLASARVAEAAGFPDRGWGVIGWSSE
jgi:GNAT superfamily N-acetyltransferase